MQQTIITFPPTLEAAISQTLNEQGTTLWLKRAQILHSRYMEQEKGTSEKYIKDYDDCLAYLALRAPATYAQTVGALSQVLELVPSWKPKTMLDIGSGPGVGVWAAHTLLPSIEKITCMDQDYNFHLLGKKICSQAEIPTSVEWEQSDIADGIGQKQMYDFVLISNVLNELSIPYREEILRQAFNRCKGIVLLIEPGTPYGSNLIQSTAKSFSQTGMLLAPYIENTFVKELDYWLHFPQRFIRPEFTHRLRQQMRDATPVASDWEEAKYSYVSISKMPPEIKPWARCVGPVEIQKGFLEVPVLTKDTLIDVKVMKRHKEQYHFAKKLHWGQIIFKSEDLIYS